MKKSFVAISVMTLMATVAQAAVLTPEQAYNRALSQDTKIHPLSVAESAPILVETKMATGGPAYYVFNNGQESEGFIIVSADDVAEAVLGYSDSGSFDPGNISPATAWWLEEYASQIEWARTSDRVATANTARPVWAPIAPMVKTKWNQSKPFNNMCPTINDTHCVTGCVATAMAQIMNYHRWPATHGTSSSSYTWNGQTLSFDYANTTFDWANMLDVYASGAYNDTQANAVATLMYACGVSVEMSYSTGSSGAPTSYVCNALKDYFGYDKSVHSEYRCYYSTAEWEELIYDQLKTYGPVQYSGHSNSGGHSFVCDGYSTDGYFHINWGWGGVSDGYFLLSALNPRQQGIGGSTSGYNFDQYIIANIRPSTGSDAEYIAMAVSGVIELSATECAVGSSVSLVNLFYNVSSTSISGNIGFRYVNTATGEVTDNPVYTLNNLRVNYGYYNVPIKALSTLGDGTYKITPIFKLTGEEWRPVQIDRSGPDCIIMTISGSTAKFSLGTAPQITVSDIKAATPFYIDNTAVVNATATNSGTMEYSRAIRGVLMNSDGTIIGEGSKYPLYVDGGESQEIIYQSTYAATEGNTLSAGPYRFGFVDAETNELITSTIDVNLMDAPATTTVTLSNIAMPGYSKDSSGVYLDVDRDKMTITADVTCSAGYYAGGFTLYIFPNTGGTSLASISSGTVFLNENETKTVEFNGQFTTGELGETYFAYVYDKSGSKMENSFVRFTLSKTSGIDSVATDSAEVVATEVYNLNGVFVSDKEDGLMPGHYIVRRKLADGSIEVGHRIIK